jgi:hypothetical protein
VPDTPITISEQIREAKRELGLRQAFYPPRVRAGKMNARLAARQIDVQAAIVATLIDLRQQRGEDDAQGSFIE